MHLRQFPDDYAKVGLAWKGPDSNDFYSNASILATALGLAGANSVCANFREHDVKKRKRSDKSGPIPSNFPNRRQWKVRFYDGLNYNCDESAADSITWRKRTKLGSVLNMSTSFSGERQMEAPSSDLIADIVEGASRNMALSQDTSVNNEALPSGCPKSNPPLGSEDDLVTLDFQSFDDPFLPSNCF
jgi:hypothetical protein